VSEGEVLAIRLNETDDVAVVLGDVNPGQSVRVAGKGPPVTVSAREPVPQHHKIALTAIRKGSDVVRSGMIIGRAIEAIDAGRCVHVHNLVSRRGGRDEVDG